MTKHYFPNSQWGEWDLKEDFPRSEIDTRPETCSSHGARRKRSKLYSNWSFRQLRYQFDRVNENDISSYLSYQILLRQELTQFSISIFRCQNWKNLHWWYLWCQRTLESRQWDYRKLQFKMVPVHGRILSMRQWNSSGNQKQENSMRRSTISLFQLYGLDAASQLFSSLLFGFLSNSYMFVLAGFIKIWLCWWSFNRSGRFCGRNQTADCFSAPQVCELWRSSTCKSLSLPFVWALIINITINKTSVSLDCKTLEWFLNPHI